MKKTILTCVICSLFTTLSFSQNKDSECWQYAVKQIARDDCNSNGIFEWTVNVDCSEATKVVLENKKYNKKKGEYYWNTIKTFYFETTAKTSKYKSTGLKVHQSYDYRLICVRNDEKYKDYKNSIWEYETLNVTKKCN